MLLDALACPAKIARATHHARRVGGQQQGKKARTFSFSFDENADTAEGKSFQAVLEVAKLLAHIHAHPDEAKAIGAAAAASTATCRQRGPARCRRSEGRLHASDNGCNANPLSVLANSVH